MHADVSVKVSKAKVESKHVIANITLRYLDLLSHQPVKTVMDSNVYTRRSIEEKLAEMHGNGAMPTPKMPPKEVYVKIPCEECTRRHLAKDSPKGAEVCGIDKQPLTKGHVCPLDSRPRLKKSIIALIKAYNEVDLLAS